MFVRSRTIASKTPLTDEQLLASAPSIFADAAHESRSSRYAHIPTIKVVEGMRSHGFLPMLAMQSRVRDNSTGRQEFTKHMIRFRHADYSNQLTVGDTFPEVIMVNSHDGTSSYQLNAGLFRLVCANGMVAAQGDLAAVRVQHTGEAVRQVIDASFRVLDDSRKALDISTKWKQKLLTETEQYALAVGAHHLRFADAHGNVDTPIKPEQLLRPRRTADASADLWTTFNRVQENVIRGGLRAWDRNGDGGKVRKATTREVKGIDGNVTLNRALWKMAEALAASRN